MLAMSFNDDTISHIRAYRIILSILFLEILCYFLSDIHVASFAKNTFINFEQDPLLWLAYCSGIPQLVLHNNIIGAFVDVAILLFLCWLIVRPLNTLLAITVFLFLFLFYVIFTAHLGHRNYQSGYLLVLLPLFFKKQKNKEIVFEFTRYFMLFFYASAAYFKFKSGSLFDAQHFSHAVINQFTPYYLEKNLSVRTSVNLYLIAHQWFSRILFIAGTMLEFVVVIGFFTKRFDTQLAILILLFHFTNWFIMDIAPFGQIAFICMLFFSKKLRWQQNNL